MNNIEYYIGDVTNHKRDKDVVVIPHCCNDTGLMGKGVAKALYTKWPRVRSKYMEHPKMLGMVSYAREDDGKTIICNMIGQDGVMVGFNKDGTAVGNDGRPPIRYSKLAIAMMDVAGKAESYGDVEIHCPIFGCDLAGGNWDFVSALVEEIWCPMFPVKCIIHESSLGKFGYLMDK